MFREPLIISSWSFWWLFQVWDPRSCCQSCFQSEGVSRHGAPNPIVIVVVCFLSACHRLDNYHYHDLHQLIVRCCTRCPSSRGWLASPRPWATCSSCFRCPKNYCTSKYVILSHERCPTILLIDWLSDRIPSKQTPNTVITVTIFASKSLAVSSSDCYLDLILKLFKPSWHIIFFPGLQRRDERRSVDEHLGRESESVFRRDPRPWRPTCLGDWDGWGAQGFLLQYFFFAECFPRLSFVLNIWILITFKPQAGSGKARIVDSPTITEV